MKKTSAVKKLMRLSNKDIPHLLGDGLIRLNENTGRYVMTKKGKRWIEEAMRKKMEGKHPFLYGGIIHGGKAY